MHGEGTSRIHFHCVFGAFEGRSAGAGLFHTLLCVQRSAHSAVWKKRYSQLQPTTFYALNLFLYPQLMVWNWKEVLVFSVWMRLNTVIFSVMIHFSESIRFRNRFVRISSQESSCVWFCKFWGLSIVNSFNCVILTRVYVYDSSTPPISQSSDLRMWSESVRLNDHFESVQ